MTATLAARWRWLQGETVMAAAKALADEAPWSDGLTEYDHDHFVIYARLLDAAADGAADDEIVRIVLNIDPGTEPDRAKRCLASHMKRARWMSEHGYEHLLRPEAAQLKKRR